MYYKKTFLNLLVAHFVFLISSTSIVAQDICHRTPVIRKAIINTLQLFISPYVEIGL